MKNWHLEILEADKGTAPFFTNMGMHCLGCPSARNESIAQACMVHGVDVDDLIEDLEQAFEKIS